MIQTIVFFGNIIFLNFTGLSVLFCISKLRGHIIYIQLHFYEIKILYVTRISVQASISEFEALKLNDYGFTDGHTGS